MTIVKLAVVVSVVLFILASPPYVIDILHGRTKPQRITWLIWTILGTIAFISQLKLGASWSLVCSGLDALGSAAVFCLSIRFGIGGWSWSDKIALIVALAGVLIAVIARAPVIALLGVILADVSGSALTIQKTFASPDSETTITWLLVGSGALCGVIAVGRLDPMLLLYPLYLTIANYAVPVAQFAGRKLHR